MTPSVMQHSFRHRQKTMHHASFMYQLLLPCCVPLSKQEGGEPPPQGARGFPASVRQEAARERGSEGQQVLAAVYLGGGSWSATSCPTNRGQRAECEGEGKDEVVDVFMKGKLDILSMLETKREAHNGRSSIPGDGRARQSRVSTNEGPAYRG